MVDPNIDSMLKEKRIFKPSKAFSKTARVSTLKEYQRLYRQSIEKPEKILAGAGEGTDLVQDFPKGP